MIVYMIVICYVILIHHTRTYDMLSYNHIKMFVDDGVIYNFPFSIDMNA